MSTRVSANNLANAVRDLSVAWQQTKTYWRDQKSKDFEEKYLEELPNQVSQAKTAMEELDAFLRKVKNDCE
ncbi:hypothetical protein BH11VER1_BH11VER1_16270 [soil metagenome]